MTAIAIVSPSSCKTCSTCQESKPLNKFSKRTKSRDGFDQYCKTCKSAYSRNLRQTNPAYRKSELDKGKVWRAENRDAYLKLQKEYSIDNKERLSQYRKDRYLLHKDAILSINKNYYQANKEKVLARKSDYRKENRAICNIRSLAWQAMKMETDPLFKIRRNIRALISGRIRARGYTKRSKTSEILGCTWDEFKVHIERQFLKDMAWEKVGRLIHIDHITPTASAKTEREFLALNHFTNLRPVWAKDNLAKGAQITHLI